MTDLAKRIEERRALMGSQARSIEVLEDPAVSLDQRIQERRKLREQGINAPDPQAVDQTQRQRFLSEQVGEPLAEPGLDDPSLRADLGLSDLFEEKRQKFLSKFPEGDFVLVREPERPPGGALGTGGATVLFRKNQNDQYAELDAELFDKFELLNDIADLSGEVPAAVAEAAITRGGGLIKQVLKLTTGTVIGEGAKESVEALRGFQQETTQQLASKIALKGAISAGGGAATTLATGPINAIRGASAIKIAKSAPAAQRAAAELGIPPLMPQQIARSPLIRKIGGQSAATVSTIGEYIEAQNMAAANALIRLRNPELTQVLKGELSKLHESATKQTLAAADAVFPLSLTTGGTAMQAGIAEYNSLARFLVDRAYRNARQVAEPEFKSTSLLNIATQVQDTATRLGPEGTSIKSLADDVLALDPSLPPVTLNLPDGTTQTITPTAQLRFLRSRAFDLKTPAPGEISRAHNAEAAKIFAAVDHVLKNPKNADDTFQKAGLMQTAKLPNAFPPWRSWSSLNRLEVRPLPKWLTGLPSHSRWTT